MNLFSRFVDKTLARRLDTLVSKTFERMSYTEAIAILEKSHKKFEYEVRYGIDLQSEHERFLAEEHVQKPIFLFDYPKEIKPFYMRINDDEKTVAAVDLLVPGIGELIGGSQREERLGCSASAHGTDGAAEEPYWWYLDSRRYGSRCPIPGSAWDLSGF
ncbi:MAG: amino acid--tRNA ligase-related protein [Desulfotignum sp.]|nr:amino acid--tRNA ligase-related protein [Desulfotignum sp.]